MLFRLISIIILIQVLESAYGEVVIERARMQYYMQIENGKIIRHVEGDDLQDSDLNSVLPTDSVRDFQPSQPTGQSQSNSEVLITQKCGPGEWRDFWGRCRELY